MNAKTTLRKRIIHSVSWVMSGHIFSQILRLGSNLIMTRLLVPEMFGIMAIANVIMLGLFMMSDMGVHQHIIQSKHSDSVKFLNTAWVMSIIKGLVLWGCALIICWILIVLSNNNFWLSDSVYADPQLPYIISVLAFGSVIEGFNSTKLPLAYRNFALGKVVKIEAIAQITGLLVMVIWAYIERTIWALVLGALVTISCKTVLTHTNLPGYNNKLSWDRKSFYELFHFGKWIFLTSTLGFFSMNGDRLVLGGLIDANLLGIYSIAFFILNAIQRIFSKIIGTVALPTFSEVVRERPHDLNTTYYKFRLPIDGIALVTAGFLFIAGHHFIDILYDDRYKQAGYMIEILSLMLIAERYYLTEQCFIALGKPSYLVPMMIPRVLILFILLPIIYEKYGIYGALWVIALNRIAELPILFYFKIKTSLFNIYKEVYFLLFIFIGVCMGLVINKITWS